MKIIIVASARPNFMKVAPIIREFKNTQKDINLKLLHTGQHYDYEMSKIFFDELGIPEPDFHLGVGSGSHAQQTAHVMIAFEKVLQQENPDWVVAVGDVNPTMACTITANKLGIKVAHVEAGLRSGDRSMPEEINRILTDSIADLLLAPSLDGVINLGKEGIADYKIRLVGNIMIDTLFNMKEKSDSSTILSKLNLSKKDYFLLTLHRPSNIDEPDAFAGFVAMFQEITRHHPIIWPMHPRAKKRAQEFGLWEKMQAIDNLHLLEPVGYVDNIHLMQHANLILTDSGGIQEESTALGVPCLTIRKNTERPITITEGTNTLAGTDPKIILDLIQKHLQNPRSVDQQKSKPLYWDGHTAGRIVQAMIEYDEG